MLNGTEVDKIGSHENKPKYDKLGDDWWSAAPEFQPQLLKLVAAQKSLRCAQLEDQAKDSTNDAIAAASDPEFQKQLQDIANVATNPELKRKLKEAMEQAQAKAMEVAAIVTDPELQKKMQENVAQALERTRAATWSAADAVVEEIMKRRPTVLLDPEMQKRLQEQAMAALGEAKAAAAQAAVAGRRPHAALAKLRKAEKAIEMATAAALDPETRTKFAEKAQTAKLLLMYKLGMM